MKPVDISVIIPVYNAASTLKICLDSLKQQTVKVLEVLMVDNHSEDDSLAVIKKYQHENTDLPIKVLRQKETQSVASSCNLALKLAKGKYIVAMHSDSSLPTPKELEKLVSPLINNPDIIATYSYGLLPEKIWRSYNFWQKCPTSRVVGKKIPGLNGKFDCYRKKTLLKINGFDDVNFDKYGDGNDADLHHRLKKVGKVILTPAQVVHLHYLSRDYHLSNWLEKRKHMTITSGRLLKMYRLKTGFKGIASFLFRPFLALLSLIPPFQTLGWFLIVAFAFLYTPKVFTRSSMWKDPRILLVPLVNIFLIYFESFWILYTLFTHKVRVKTSL